MIEFAALDGTLVSGEVWSQGPVHGSVWVRSSPRRWHVVALAARGKPNTEVEYTPPPVPHHLAAIAVSMAQDTMHRHWRSTVHQDPYLSEVMGKPGDRDIVPPAPNQVDAARRILELEKQAEESEKAYREGHNSRNSVGEARLLELLRETVATCASETDSSTATE